MRIQWLLGASGLTMAHFGLLHGAFEGTWCWERFIPALTALGHTATAVDLPIDDPAATWDDHVDVALQAFRDRQTIIVAHSRSGRMMPTLLERGRYQHAILLAAAIPGGITSPPHQNPMMPAPTEKPATPQPADDLGRTLLTLERAERLFSGCASTDVERWLTQARPQWELPPPAERVWPALKRVHYVLGTDDQAVDPAWMRSASKERLGVEPIEVEGGHSLFLSRPDELARKFASIVEGQIAT